jgi:hypothetical protein
MVDESAIFTVKNRGLYRGGRKKWVKLIKVRKIEVHSPLFKRFHNFKLKTT